MCMCVWRGGGQQGRSNVSKKQQAAVLCNMPVTMQERGVQGCVGVTARAWVSQERKLQQETNKYCY